MKKATLKSALFVDAEVSGADFGSADLRQAIFHRATCRGTLFEGANLREADFSHAKLPLANFSGADLYRTKLHCIEEDRTLFGPQRALALGTDEELASAERFEPKY